MKCLQYTHAVLRPAQISIYELKNNFFLWLQLMNKFIIYLMMDDLGQQLLFEDGLDCLE